MKDICIIPVFNRPEYLQYTLKFIRTNPDCKDIKFIFAADYGHSHRCINVIHAEMQGMDCEIIKRLQSPYREMKQSFNLLEAYKYAASIAKDFIYLIEDDIFVGKSFFKSHRQIHAKFPQLFCSIGSHLHNKAQVDKPQTMVVDTCQMSKNSIYQSWGVCFRKDVVKNLIAPHACEYYYKKPVQYMMSKFHQHWLKGTFTEQDGLIRRIADTCKLGIGYPDYPRCYHAGIWSYHRAGEKAFTWSYEKKLQFIKDTCFDASKMKKYDEYGDVFVADLSVEADII